MNADLISVHPRPKSENNMKGNRSKNLPVFKSVDKFVAFFETHDMSEYLEKLPEVEFEVRLKKKISTGTSSKKKSVPPKVTNRPSSCGRKK